MPDPECEPSHVPASSELAAAAGALGGPLLSKGPWALHSHGDGPSPPGLANRSCDRAGRQWQLPVAPGACLGAQCQCRRSGLRLGTGRTDPAPGASAASDPAPGTLTRRRFAGRRSIRRLHPLACRQSGHTHAAVARMPPWPSCQRAAQTNGAN